MDRWEGKVAVVTGASSGIGAAITKELVNAGLMVVGLARRLERMEQLSASFEKAKGKFYAKQCDLRKEEDILNALKWVNVKFGGIDILVSNAGFSKRSRIIDDDVESFRNILEVNVMASAICIREAVASMKNRDVPGYIVIINSVLGHEVPANLARSLYPSSKFALTAMTETVRKELAAEIDNKIKITSISPGLVRTGIAEAGGGSPKMYDEMPCLEAKDIADAVLYVLKTPPKVQVTELTIRPLNELF